MKCSSQAFQVVLISVRTKSSTPSVWYVGIIPYSSEQDTIKGVAMEIKLTGTTSDYLSQ
jgi:hypothetical protein